MAAPRTPLVKGFGSFIEDYGVLPLAIGVVVGTAVNDFVKTLVDGFFTPLISLLTPGRSLQGFQITLHGAVFKVGAIVNGLLSFLVILLIVYLAVKFVIRRDTLLQKK